MVSVPAGWRGWRLISGVVGAVDAGDDGFGDIVGGRGVVVAKAVAGFAGFVVDEADIGHFT
jgi:hypothetical protein